MAAKSSNYIQTKRAKKTPGRTVKVGGKVTIKKAGKKPIVFKKGGLHQSLNVPQKQKIPSSKMQAALAGKYGKKAQKQARFAKNVLSKGRKTAKKR